jgi:endogenous inhibitor of DNA gyrase (YacG/DUF329 family)
VCGKPGSAETAPFCSQGCRDRDLLNWLGDAYRVPGPAVDEGSPDFEPDFGRERLDSEG